ncbi:MAG: Cupin 2 conserved barrel domain protein [Candidatus Beckwithbacteria bacterium GW2011_GWB1_47_15]|uniref:Cupin 2 conserved barrel domain protein n=1 Tax=Candidatus Beckwithbacteria bacterium GW2011_GWB1_47_15 TaxID=1618371 RepID=A0A0G1RXL6_9BACT|nr:MAG: Cupin 2 conserved barrel domain protein [Candidatus Beckwithbacteria bacterium GW2011_GWC1_49_16]AQS30711.1 hypothetical protein [uncultured bacterium]KKU35898.1 MAG: Cupin 2 conserved barrel domain protein [Candidatus Beckwithbacteria bacterium GW2011_GWA1_46_30]KKU61862.1 MAG: Cupin 2 conserved barrel domain protein [Candidatus Beckwithbacteria bacterium GW2011_GWB1_47_15]KKU72584.1 MAG: Cupin 2 conserved barrel domain protein [Candidatus Beckwithbacteria bacterium GW2011_GWA2_47_25]
MNTEKIIGELKAKYPGKAIILNPEDSPTEIIVEIEPTKDHLERSLALAVVGKSKPHYHKTTTEVYEVVKGELTLFIDGKKHVLKQGEKMTIKPGSVHSAEGDEAWFYTYSTPGWTFADHILTE